MLRWLKWLLAGSSVALLIGVSVVAWLAFSAPAFAPAPLAAGLVDVRSAEGVALLDATHLRADHDLLLPFFVTQSRRAFCGVASSVIAINALRHPMPLLSQAGLFDGAVSAPSAIAISFSGLTLEQLADLLRAHQMQVSVIFAADTDLDSFRRFARSALADPSDALIANYDRVTLHQEGMGHISPVTAYHEGSDRFLVLDVAAHKYPPTWVPAAELWRAMNTQDPDSGKSRGFISVRKPS